MSDDITITPDETTKAYLAEFIALAQKLSDSPEFKELTARLSEVNIKIPKQKPANKTSHLTVAGASNLIFGVAIQGLFLGYWSEFELISEVLLMKLTGMTAKNTSIVCTPIQSGYKVEIILALLTEQNDQEGINLGLRLITNS